MTAQYDTRFGGFFLTIFLLMLGATESYAQQWQWPEKSENLQVLPETTTAQELREIMTGFSQALGVRCHHCHDDSNGRRFDQMDFAADTKETKEVARIMMQMVQRINGDTVPQVERTMSTDAAVQVTCVTCHRGLAVPRMLEDVLAEEVAQQGIDAAVARYRELRAEYYGGFSYDFSERVLIGLAQELAAQGNTDAALVMLDLNLEMYPESWQTHVGFSQVYQQQGDTNAAIEHLEKALAANPGNPFLSRQLEQLRSQ